MNLYRVFYNGKQADITAPTSYAAQQAGIRLFKVKSRFTHWVSVVLLAKDGVPVVHSTASL